MDTSILCIYLFIYYKLLPASAQLELRIEQCGVWMNFSVLIFKLNLKQLLLQGC